MARLVVIQDRPPTPALATTAAATVRPLTTAEDALTRAWTRELPPRCVRYPRPSRGAACARCRASTVRLPRRSTRAEPVRSRGTLRANARSGFGSALRRPAWKPERRRPPALLPSWCTRAWPVTIPARTARATRRHAAALRRSTTSSSARRPTSGRESSRPCATTPGDGLGVALRRGRSVEVPRGERRGIEADLMSDPAPREVVGRNMNAAPQARLPGLVRRIGVRRPLQTHLGGGPLLEGEKRVLARNELAKPPGEVRTSCEDRQHLGARPAEGAVA